jgi:hypothetical protein
VEIDRRQARQGECGRHRYCINSERPLSQADPIQQDLICDDRKAEGRDRKVVAAQPHGEQGQHRTGEARQHDCASQCDPERNSELRDQEGRRIRAKAVEGRLTEIELARIAEHEIESDRQCDVQGANG